MIAEPASKNIPAIISNIFTITRNTKAELVIEVTKSDIILGMFIMVTAQDSKLAVPMTIKTIAADFAALTKTVFSSF